MKNECTQNKYIIISFVVDILLSYMWMFRVELLGAKVELT